MERFAERARQLAAEAADEEGGEASNPPAADEEGGEAPNLPAGG